jgi:hypothetical protein
MISESSTGKAWGTREFQLHGAAETGRCRFLLGGITVMSTARQRDVGFGFIRMSCRGQSSRHFVCVKKGSQGGENSEPGQCCDPWTQSFISLHKSGPQIIDVIGAALSVEKWPPGTDSNLVEVLT